MPVLYHIFHDPIYQYYSFALLCAWPVVRIFRRAGLKDAYALLLIVPIAGFIACAGILALSPWPALKKKEK